MCLHLLVLLVLSVSDIVGLEIDIILRGLLILSAVMETRLPHVRREVKSALTQARNFEG